MVANNIASGNEGIDIEENRADNEINNTITSENIRNSIVENDGDDDRSNNTNDSSGATTAVKTGIASTTIAMTGVSTTGAATTASTTAATIVTATTSGGAGISSIRDDSSKDNLEQFYPSDCYSFLSIYGPTENPEYFFYGLVICLFQLAFLTLFVLSVLHQKFASKGDVDSK